MLVVKQAVCKSLRKLRLADTGGAQEQEAADRLVGVGYACTGAEDSLCDFLNRFVLTDNALMDNIIKVEQLLALALHELCNGYTGPFCDYGRYLFLGHGVVDKGIFGALLALLFGFCETFFKRGQIVIFEFCRFFVFVVKLSLLNICVSLLDFRLELLDLVNALLFGLPARLHLVELVFVFGELGAELLKTLLGELIRFLFQSHLFDFKLHYLAAYIVKLRGHGVDLGADGSARLIDKVDCLVGQETVGNISVRKGSGGDKCTVVYANAVINFIALLESSEYRNRVFNSRLVYHNGLKTTLKSGVLFNIFAVFIERSCADAVQLAPCKHGLQKVTCVHAAFGLACADYRVQLIDEEQYPALGFLYLFEHSLESLFKLAAVLRAGDKRTHIKAENSLVFKSLGHIAAYYSLRKALGDSGLADAGLADKHGVVLSFSRKNTNDISYLRVTADNGIKLVFARTLDKVGAVFRKCVVSILGVVAGYRACLDL